MPNGGETSKLSFKLVPTSILQLTARLQLFCAGFLSASFAVGKPICSAGTAQLSAHHAFSYPPYYSRQNLAYVYWFCHCRPPLAMPGSGFHLCHYLPGLRGLAMMGLLKCRCLFAVLFLEQFVAGDDLLQSATSCPCIL